MLVSPKTEVCVVFVQFENRDTAIPHHRSASGNHGITRAQLAVSSAEDRLACWSISDTTTKVHSIIYHGRNLEHVKHANANKSAITFSTFGHILGLPLQSSQLQVLTD
jgi:hypothetical protein